MGDLERIVFFGRTLEEYERMFQIKCQNYSNMKILDCPGGPSSFNATARRLYSVNVTSVDPMYSKTFDDLKDIGECDIEYTMSKIRASPEKYPLIKDHDVYNQSRIISLTEFLEDYRAANHLYINTLLPSLPFENNSFDIVLSGYLLFAYSSVQYGGLITNGGFDFDWHCAATLELLRVAKSEVRIYPAYTYGEGEPRVHPFVDRLAAFLGEEMAEAVALEIYRIDDTSAIGLVIKKIMH